MTTWTRWMSSLSLSPLAVLTLQGLPLDAQGLTDMAVEVREAAARRAAQQAAAAAPVQYPVTATYVPVTAKRLDGFKPVLPPERASGLAMAQAHAQAQVLSAGPALPLATAAASPTTVKR